MIELISVEKGWTRRVASGGDSDLGKKEATEKNVGNFPILLEPFCYSLSVSQVIGFGHIRV